MAGSTHAHPTLWHTSCRRLICIPCCREVEGAWGRVGMFFPGPPLSPRPGAPSVPPSRADPGPLAGCTPKVKNVFWLKIDAKSIPEALATTILILQKFSIDLAHRQNHGASAHPDPSGTPHPPPSALPAHPCAPPHPCAPLRTCTLLRTLRTFKKHPKTKIASLIFFRKYQFV